MSNPKISVIIPHWNRVDLLPATLECFLQQTLKPYEIIVVDDHSTQDISELKAAFEPKGVKFFINEGGKGPGAARNYGFQKSTGEFIKWFDSDDLLTINSLEVQYKALAESDKPFVCSPYVHVNFLEDGTWRQVDPILQYQNIPFGTTIRENMVHGLFIHISGMMFKRSLIEKVGPWRTDIYSYEDWDLLWRIGALVDRPAHTNGCCFLYRFHGGQTTGAHFNDLQRDKEKIICFTDAEKSLQENSKYSGQLDNIFLGAQILHSLQGLKHLPEYATLHHTYNTLPNKMASMVQRIRFAINRKITKTSWQVMHGPNASPEKFREYLAQLPSSNKN